MEERDCEHCIHKVPVFDEEGYCKYASCDSWDCEFVSRKEALQAFEENKALRLLLDWATECDFGYDNFPEVYERYKDAVTGMPYKEGMIYIAQQEIKRLSENKDS